MILKCKCKNGHYIEIKEYNFLENPQEKSLCPICNEQLELLNLDEQIRDNITTWFKELGIEYTLEMIERNKRHSCYRLYKEELKRRGLK